MGSFGGGGTWAEHLHCSARHTAACVSAAVDAGVTDDSQVAREGKSHRMPSLPCHARPRQRRLKRVALDALLVCCKQARRSTHGSCGRSGLGVVPSQNAFMRGHDAGSCRAGEQFDNNKEKIRHRRLVADSKNRQDKRWSAGIVGEERVQCRVPGRKAEIGTDRLSRKKHVVMLPLSFCFCLCSRLPRPHVATAPLDTRVRWKDAGTTTDSQQEPP